MHDWSGAPGPGPGWYGPAVGPYAVDPKRGPGPAPVAPNGPGGLLGNPRFLRGALIGAAAAYVLTNENVQQAAIKALVRLQSAAQGGFEELKERFRDAEAELHAAQAQDAD